MHNFDYSKNPEMAVEMAREILPTLVRQNRELLPLLTIDDDDERARNILDNEDQISRWVFNGKVAYSLASTLYDDRVRHDMANESLGVFANLELAVIKLKKEDHDAYKKKLEGFLEEWGRYWVVLEDLLLRIISKESVEEENVGELDVDVFKNLFNYFKSTEIRNLKDRVDYDKVGGVNFRDETDYINLKKVLEKKAIRGNAGLVGNLSLNAWRNALRNRTDAKNVVSSLNVEGNNLVFKIMDDGIGIDGESLQPDNERFIFKEGVGNNGSSGLGLSSIEKRLGSTGGDLRVFSFRGSEKKVNKYPIEANFELDNFNEQRKKQGKPIVNTIFEVRLSLENK